MATIPTAEEIVRRRQRFDALVCAQAALPEPMRSGDSLARSANRIGMWLEKLGTCTNGTVPLGGELAQLDVDLASHADSLRRLVDDVGPEELCSSHSAATPRDRSQVLALLDLLLEDEARLAERWQILERMATWLSTDQRLGRIQIAQDPVIAAPRLVSAAQRMNGANIDAIVVEREFVDAANRCADGELEGIESEMNARKAELGLALFLPAVLRAVVFYNTAVWNRARGARGDSETEPAAQNRAPGESTSVPIRSEAPAPEFAPPEAMRALLEKPVAAPARAAEPAPKRLPRSLVKRVAVAVLPVGVAFLLWSHLPDSVRELPAEELRAISPRLGSAYRNGSGLGRLFVGTVAPDWAGRSPAQRESDAQAIVAALRRDGVREILLYDAAHRIVVQHAEGLPTRVAR